MKRVMDLIFIDHLPSNGQRKSYDNKKIMHYFDRCNEGNIKSQDNYLGITKYK